MSPFPVTEYGEFIGNLTTKLVLSGAFNNVSSQSPISNVGLIGFNNNEPSPFVGAAESLLGSANALMGGMSYQISQMRLGVVSLGTAVF